MLDAIGLVSSDINKSLNFYKLFGLEFEQFESSEHYECTLPNGLRLMMDSEELMRQIYPDYKKTENTTMSFAFKQNSPEQVNQLVNEVQNAGYTIKKQPWDAFWGQRYASVIDPDGNQIDIFANS